MFMSVCIPSPYQRETQLNFVRRASRASICCSLPSVIADDKMDEEKNDLKHGTLHVDDVEADTAMGQHVKVDEKMSAFESIRRFPKAIACCSYMLFICIMWGYDGMAGSVSTNKFSAALAETLRSFFQSLDFDRIMGTSTRETTLYQQNGRWASPLPRFSESSLVASPLG